MDKEEALQGLLEVFNAFFDTGHASAFRRCAQGRQKLSSTVEQSSRPSSLPDSQQSQTHLPSSG
eukprot:3937733-Rhodomonas_salina.1